MECESFYYEEEGRFSNDNTPSKYENERKFQPALLKVRKAIDFSESISRENSTDNITLVKKQKDLYFVVDGLKFQGERRKKILN